MTPIETYEHDGCTINIMEDECVDSPREICDNLSTMVFLHKRHQLGDEGHGYKSENYGGWHSLKKAIMKDHSPATIVAVYMMDHSGLTITVNPDHFHAADPQGWDWGQIGWAFITRDKALSEYGGKNLSAKKREKALKRLLGEVETYDQFIRGEVYGYEVTDANGEFVDSLWGCYGMDYTKEEAESQAKRHNKSKTQEKENA